MPESHKAHKHSHDAGGITDRLREKGYRLTPQRLMILAAIEGSHDHISAEDIYAQVSARYPQVNISTVYRTLEMLKKLNLVYEIDLGEGRIRYHAEASGHHHHLVCQECGKIIDIDEAALAPLRDVLLREHGFLADLKHVGVFGLCEDCRKKKAGGKI
jgi:Fur family ferric uptake transcriptional regulator